METYFAEPDTIFVFKIFYEVLGGGTRLAMPKTICAPDLSSLKLGSGATEGVLDCGVFGWPDYTFSRTPGLGRYKIEDFVPCPEGTFLGVEGKLGDTDM